MAAAAASASASASVQQRLSAKRLSQELDALASSGLAPWSNFAAAAAAASANGNLNTVVELQGGGGGGSGAGGGIGMPPPPPISTAQPHLNSFVPGSALSSASIPSSLNNQLSWPERSQNSLQSAAMSAQFGNISDSQALLSGQSQSLLSVQSQSLLSGQSQSLLSAQSQSLLQLRGQNASFSHPGHLQPSGSNLTPFGSQTADFGGIHGGINGGPLSTSLSSSSSPSSLSSAAGAGIAKPRCLRLGSAPSAMSLPPHQLAAAAAWF